MIFATENCPASSSRVDQRQLVEVDQGALVRTDLAPREVEQALDDAGDPRGLFRDDAGILLDGFGVLRLALDRPGAARDDVERRADLVRDLGRELADRRELLGLTKPLLERELRLVLSLGLRARLAQREGHVIEPRRDRSDLVVALGQDHVREVALGDVVDPAQ